MRTDVGKSQQCVTKRADNFSWLKTELQGSFEEQFYRRISFFVALNIRNKSPQELRKPSPIYLFQLSSVSTFCLPQKKKKVGKWNKIQVTFASYVYKYLEISDFIFGITFLWQLEFNWEETAEISREGYLHPRKGKILSMCHFLRLCFLIKEKANTSEDTCSRCIIFGKTAAI